MFTSVLTYNNRLQENDQMSATVPKQSSIVVLKTNDYIVNSFTLNIIGVTKWILYLKVTNCKYQIVGSYK